jgi:hypothetical protein
MERIGIAAVLTASLLLTACNMDLSISQLVPDSQVALNKPVTGELVSASTQFEQSNVRGYLIQASAGSMTTDQVLTSNVRGYKMYQGVQAQIISQDPR